MIGHELHAEFMSMNFLYFLFLFFFFFFFSLENRKSVNTKY